MSEKGGAEHGHKVQTRCASFLVLTALVAGVGYGARGTYRIATDSFVAPITLSPDSDVVITSKLRLSELYAERAKMAVECERIDSELAASASAINSLEELKKVAEGALRWTHTVTAESDRAGQDDLRALEQREQNLREMYAKQEGFVREVEKNVAAGLAAKADYVRETMALSQLRLALVDTQRWRLATELQLKQARLAQQALAGKNAGPMMPEMIAQHSQQVHVELEIVKLKAEQRSLEAKKVVAEQEIQKIDELTGQMMARPLYRAIEEHLELAFVPYTQIEGIRPGADVHECVWGLFGCEHVGKVTELLPGEVIAADPWGAQARGQYAVLKLSDPEAAKARVLRVRGGALQTSPAVSARADAKP